MAAYQELLYCTGAIVSRKNVRAYAVLFFLSHGTESPPSVGRSRRWNNKESVAWVLTVMSRPSMVRHCYDQA